jgi:NAD(P)-dependent dehydrogenase (short-subunit alcohol dehydrogenase family)
MELADQLALITGGTGGIGKATSLALGKLGCNVAVHYNSAVDTAGHLVEELRGLGVKAEAFQADLTKYDEVWLLLCLRFLGTRHFLHSNCKPFKSESVLSGI